MSYSSIESLRHRQVEMIPHQQVDIGEPTRLGDALAIVGHHFAHPVSNADLLEMAMGLGLPESQRDAAQRAIAATGFTNRYFSHFPGDESNVGGAVERTTNIGAILLREAIRAKGWEDRKDPIDIFIDSSAFLPISINQEILEKAGLNPDQIISQSYRYACAGAIGAFIDCLANPALREKRIVITALEPISLFVDKTQFLSPEGLSFPSIFGDAYTALAFNPSHFRLENKQVLIQPDGGVIKLPTLYDFDEVFSEPDIPPPPYYRFANGGEKIFRYSSHGPMVNILPPDPDNASDVFMDGIETGLFFGDQTAAVIIDLLKENGERDLLKKLGNKNIIMHPASRPVVNRVAKHLSIGDGYKYLQERKLPFLMDVAGYSNTSSATTLNLWRYMIENNLIDTNQPMLWIAPGIGSVVAGAIGWVKP